MNPVAVVVVVAIVAWGALALMFAARSRAPRRYWGCCPECGHRRCAFHALCEDCTVPDEPVARSISPTGRPYR